MFMVVSGSPSRPITRTFVIFFDRFGGGIERCSCSKQKKVISAVVSMDVSLFRFTLSPN